MANKKYDGVVEAVRYAPEGKVDQVRVYLRRGAAWTDLVLMNRKDLIAALKAGKRMVAGTRVPFMAGTFELSTPLQLKHIDGQEILYTRQLEGSRDNLEGIALF